MHSALPLGRLLVASGLLTQQALDEVLLFQKTDGRRLGELLDVKGLVRPHQLAQFLSHQLATPWVSLQRVEVAREAIDKLPREIALKHHMVPVHLRTSKGSTALYVAMDDPTDGVALSEAARAATMPVKPMIALTSEIRMMLDRLYGAGLAPPSPPEGPRERAPSVASIVPPSISVKDDGHPRTTPSRPPKPPPPPKASILPPPREEALLEDVEVIDEAPGSRPTPSAKVVVIHAADAGATHKKENLVVSVREAAARLGAETIGASLADAANTAAEHSPCAIVVTEEVYSNERLGLDRLALDAGAQLIVSSEDFQSRQLESLLEGAIKRWRRSSYEKGSILEGRYELLRDVGGRVGGSRWEIRQLRTARRLLLKVGVRSAHDETDAAAVRREQMALARIHHPGAVDLRDAGNTELGDPYIVVEMLEGRTLEGLVAARGALLPDEATSVVNQIGQVLAAAHDVGVLHGVVRPDNVLVVRDAWGVERVKLVHWESATIVDAGPTTSVGHDGGASSRVNGVRAEHRDKVAQDLAGLGSCAFLAFVGRARNEGEDITSLVLPKKLATVIGRTLVGPNRFASVKDFLDAFEIASPKVVGPTQLLQADPERRGISVTTTGATTPDAPLPSELRRSPRAAYRTPVRIEVSGIGAIDGRSEEISEGGLFVVTNGKIADGAEVTVRFALPVDGKVVSESGVVRWIRAPRSGDGGEPRGIGIEFSAAGPESVTQIARYVSFTSSEAS